MDCSLTWVKLPIGRAGQFDSLENKKLTATQNGRSFEKEMTSYSFWNNKGGVGKSFLCFIAASEYAHREPGTDVYVIDLCPQANVSETILGGHDIESKAITSLMNKKPRATIGGYVEARLNSPFSMISDIDPYVTQSKIHNSKMPDNLWLVCGDNILEVLSEAIRQTSQLAIPVDAWKKVTLWVGDLVDSLRVRSEDRDAVFFIDCNPSFAVYTQLGLVASDFVILPFTADESSRRGIENVIPLLYGVGDSHAATYARLSFSKNARDHKVAIPKLHTFVNNRVTLYEGTPSKAFQIVSNRVKSTVDKIYKDHRSFFANPRTKPSVGFIEVPDYHSASIVSATTGSPLHALKPGPKKLDHERVQLNKEPLERYKLALTKFVDCL